MTAAVLGAISVKGREPLPRPVDLTADSADLVDVSAPFTVRHEPPAGAWGYEMPTFARLVLPAPIDDPALEAVVTAIIAAPVEHIGATDTTTVLPAVPSGYIGRHLGPGQTAWKPAHTRAAARRRARHARPAGQRPDLRIEQTQALDIDRIKQRLAAGGAQ